MKLTMGEDKGGGGGGGRKIVARARGKVKMKEELGDIV